MKRIFYSMGPLKSHVLFSAKCEPQLRDQSDLIAAYVTGQSAPVLLTEAGFLLGRKRNL